MNYVPSFLTGKLFVIIINVYIGHNVLAWCILGDREIGKQGEREMERQGDGEIKQYDSFIKHNELCTVIFDGQTPSNNNKCSYWSQSIGIVYY